MSEKCGVLLCGHGSRDVEAVAEFSTLAESLKARLPAYPVAYGYLEFARPILRQALDSLRTQGVDRVLAVPGMLFAAGHAKNDIPSVLNTYAAEHGGLRIDYGKDLGIDPKMLRAAADRIEEGLKLGKGDVPLEETLLVVIGRGSSDPDANANVNKVMRLLWEGFGFGWAVTGFSGVTFPVVEPALEHAARLPYRRIIVFPYFLFTGILVERIYEATDRVAARHPHIEFIKAPYLNDHPLVVDTFVERIEQILVGDTHMNCGMCKYRSQVLGFEHEVGAPQRSHHHHVEGIGTGAAISALRPAAHHHDHVAHSHDHDHRHGHAHDHRHGHGHPDEHDHHAPYPHADHPHGPRSLKK